MKCVIHHGKSGCGIDLSAERGAAETDPTKT
jgi:hypothetical protein